MTIHSAWCLLGLLAGACVSWRIWKGERPRHMRIPPEALYTGPVSDETLVITTTGPLCRCDESPYLCDLHPATEDDERS